MTKQRERTTRKQTENDHQHERTNEQTNTPKWNMRRKRTNSLESDKTEKTVDKGKEEEMGEEDEAKLCRSKRQKTSKQRSLAVAEESPEIETLGEETTKSQSSKSGGRDNLEQYTDVRLCKQLINPNALSSLQEIARRLRLPNRALKLPAQQRTDLIQRLVAMISEDSCEIGKLIPLAAECIASLATNDSDRAQLRKAGALGKLVGLLEKAEMPTKELTCVADALGRMITDSATASQLVAEGAVQVLIGLLKPDREAGYCGRNIGPSLIHGAVAVLAKLAAKAPEAAETAGKVSAGRTLANYITDLRLIAQRTAAALAIHHLAADAIVREEFLATGAQLLLVQLLASTNDSAKSAAVAALASLAADESTVRRVARALTRSRGGLRSLGNLLRSASACAGETDRRYAARLVEALAHGGGPAVRDAVVRCCTNELVKMIRDAGSLTETRTAATKAITALASYEPEIRLDLFAYPVLYSLSQLLSSVDYKSQTAEAAAGALALERLAEEPEECGVLLLTRGCEWLKAIVRFKGRIPDTANWAKAQTAALGAIAKLANCSAVRSDIADRELSCRILELALSNSMQISLRVNATMALANISSIARTEVFKAKTSRHGKSISTVAAMVRILSVPEPTEGESSGSTDMATHSAVKVYAATVLTNLAHIDKARSQLLSHGGVEVLSRLLTASAEVRSMAVAALSNIARGDEDTLRVIADTGAIKPLLAMANSGLETTLLGRAFSATLLRIMSQYDDLRILIDNAGGLPGAPNFGPAALVAGAMLQGELVVTRAIPTVYTNS